uniref:Actin filament-associated protein 1-like 1 n=1 Tax=Neolamprologus brichardi TaxID=32507 RepID=A0A3Q4GPR6_NEOBR
EASSSSPSFFLRLPLLLLLLLFLGSLLKMLDHETVSPATAEKMASIRNILDSLQLSVNGSDVYMNSCLYGNGTSFVESLFEDFGCDLHMLSASPVEQKEHKDEEEKTHPNKSTPTDTPPPPLPTTPLPDDYYEEAVPLDPGSTPQYFTTTSRNSVEDAYYEDADNNYPTTRMNGPPKSSYNDSDALSSSYESYEEEEEEAKGRDQPQRWTAEERTDGPVRDCRICAFLLRKKRFGQWAKQLVVVRDNKLQCFKSIKESSPNTELPLNLCNVIYVPKEGRKKRHELRFSLPGGEALVLAVQSKEQAQRWLKVPFFTSLEVCNTEGLDGSTSPIIQRKLELDKVSVLICRQASDSDSGPTADSQATAHGSGRDTTDSLILFAETGSSTLPEELHYDYIDVDTLTDIRHAARHSFLWATTANSSSSASIDSRTYDEVYESVEVDVESRGGQVRRHASFSSRDSEKTEQQAAIKRHASNVNQYGRYGKTRAEEDARRYLREKEELEKQKEDLRNALISLRKEKRQLKEEGKSGTGNSVEKQLAELETLCKQKEEERVELELRLTEVKENLKKSLARGALGPPTDTKIYVKAQGSKVEKVYMETVPVNAASELRKRPPSLYASSKGNVMQKAKEWESKKGT